MVSLAQLLLLIGLQFTLGEQGILLQRSRSDTLWIWSTVFKFGAGSGWSRDVGTGSYVACDLASTQTNHTNSWQVSEFIQSQDAKEVTVQLTFTARQCPGGYTYCVQYFNVFALHADTALAGGVTQDSIKGGNFTFVHKILASSVWASGQTPQDNVVSVKLTTSKRGFYLALQDIGACIAVNGINVTYKHCPTVVRNGVTYRRTIAPASSDNVTQVEGNCSSHSTPYPFNTALLAQCSESGNWTTKSGYACVCDSGFENSGDVCQACASGKYKSSVGNLACTTCPRHSHPSPSRDSCDCDIGYYRALSDQANGSCSGPPTEPRNLTATVISTRVAIVTWLPPQNTGGRNDITYDVTCNKCLGSACNLTCNDVIFQPANQGLVWTYTTITVTGTFRSYEITVAAKNGVSKLAGVGALKSDTFTFTLPILSTISPTLEQNTSSLSPSSSANTTTRPSTNAIVTTENSTPGLNNYTGGQGSREALIGGYTKRQLLMAIGVSVAGTFTLCLMLAVTVVLCRWRMWNPKVSCKSTSHVTSNYNGESSSTIGTEMNEPGDSMNGLLPPKTPHTDNESFNEGHESHEKTIPTMPSNEEDLAPRPPMSRDAWSPAPPRRFSPVSTPKSHSQESIKSSVSSSSWFPQQDVQYDI